MQTIPAGRASELEGALTDDQGEISLPLHHGQQAREILGNDPCEAEDLSLCSRELSRFVHTQTQRLLPEKFKGFSQDVARALIDAANEFQMDPLLLMAVVSQESRFNPEALGRHGEIGLMQIKPSTAAWLARRTLDLDTNATEMRELLRDPAFNVRLGAAYLSHLRVRFPGDGRLYISAYNQGASSVRLLVSQGTQPRIYSSKVIAKYARLSDSFQTERIVLQNLVPEIKLSSFSAGGSTSTLAWQ